MKLLEVSEGRLTIYPPPQQHPIYPPPQQHRLAHMILSLNGQYAEIHFDAQEAKQIRDWLSAYIQEEST